MATIMAVTMILFLGMAMAAMASLYAVQLKRTRAANVQGQQRQMLLVGELMGRQMLVGASSTPGWAQGFSIELTPALPAPLLQRGAVLSAKISSHGATEALGEIHARIGAEDMQQRVRWVRAGDKWDVASAEMVSAVLQ